MTRLIFVLRRGLFAAFAIALVGAMSAQASASTTLTLGPNLLASAQTIGGDGFPVIGGSTACAVRNADAAIEEPPLYDTPSIAAQMGIEGTTMLRVDVAANGVLSNAEVMESSSNQWLDREALAAAHRVQFKPEVRDCRAIAGAYALDVAFTDD